MPSLRRPRVSVVRTGLLESVVEPGLRALGAVIVAPDGDCPQWRNPACEAVCREALSYAKANFAIEDQKSLITGYSKGGIGTWDLGLRLADSFSAAIVMAGQPPPNFEVGKWALPVRVLTVRMMSCYPLSKRNLWSSTLKSRAQMLSLRS